jgi:hypothetical protein
VYAILALDPRTQQHEISIQYQDYKDIFEKKNVDALLEHQPYECAIDLEERTQPPFGPIITCCKTNSRRFEKTLMKNLEKGFIRHSKSPIGAPILFVNKKDGSLYTCVNYRGLNSFTIKNQYLLPLISRLLDQFNHTKVYTKTDLHGTYNLVHIREGDEWKMVFRTCYDHFEYVVMAFGLTNALAVFQHMMNDVFHEYLDDFVV